MTRIAVLASGEGSNFEALVNASREGILEGQIVGLITNRKGIPALDRAQRLNIPYAAITPKSFSQRSEWDSQVLKTLQEWKTEWVVLAGFLTLIGPQVLEAYRDRVVNIHPALLPKFGGDGMYGSRVHDAVVSSGANETGITVHLVSAEYDRGRILAQYKIPVQPGESASSVASRVRELEHRYYPRVLNDLVRGRINTD